MRPIVLAGMLIVPLGAAHAELPRLNAACPDGISVHVDAEGRVFVDDREAEVDSSHLDHYEATVDDLTVTLIVKPDGRVDVSFARPDGSEGVCPTSGSGL